jgi:hypothetical protein
MGNCCAKQEGEPNMTATMVESSNKGSKGLGKPNQGPVSHKSKYEPNETITTYSLQQNENENFTEDEKKVKDPHILGPCKEILDLVQKFGMSPFTLKTYPGMKNPYKKLMSEECTYFGQVDSLNQFQGKGQLLNNSSFQVGYFYNNKRHGPCKTFLKNGQYISADWSNDLLDGECVYFNELAGQKSVVNYKQNLKEGPAEESWEDGAFFKGSYKNGVKDGKGEMRWPDGNVYVGSFKDGMFDGAGTYTWVDGKYYKGNWIKDKMEGLGEFFWPDGRSYKGGYLNDLKEGYGVFTWSEKKKYEGHWSKGKQHGQGKLYEDTGKVTHGIWECGILTKEFKA